MTLIFDDKTILEECNLQPWWEKVRQFFGRIMGLTSLYVLTFVHFSGVKCIPSTNTSLAIGLGEEPAQVSFINTYCTSQLPLLHRRFGDILIVIAGSAHLLDNCWTTFPRVRKAIQGANECLKNNRKCDNDSITGRVYIGRSFFLLFWLIASFIFVMWFGKTTEDVTFVCSAPPQLSRKNSTKQLFLCTSSRQENVTWIRWETLVVLGVQIFAMLAGITFVFHGWSKFESFTFEIFDKHENRRNQPIQDPEPNQPANQVENQQVGQVENQPPAQEEGAESSSTVATEPSKPLLSQQC